MLPVLWKLTEKIGWRIKGWNVSILPSSNALVRGTVLKLTAVPVDSNPERVPQRISLPSFWE
jgi:hypothetical protein